MEWTLKHDGDLDEQHFSHYIESTWPNYEVFWATFIVPLTNRPDDIRFRPNVNVLLRRMAEAHYSIFWHLATAHRLLDLTEEPPGEIALLFDSILFHTSAATEMVEDFLFIWAKIESQIESTPLVGASPLSVDEAVEKTKEFITSDRYQRAVSDFRATGRSVNISLHTEQDVFTPFLQGAGAQAVYNTFKGTYQKVRHYRNVVAHNPILGKLMPAGDPRTLWVPCESKLHEYSEWSEVFQAPQCEDFVEAGQLASAFLKQVEEAINKLWQQIIPYCETLARKPKYQRMMGNDHSDSLGESQDRSDEPQEEHTHTSGSAIAPPAS